MKGYDFIKTLSKKHRIKAPDLLVLAPQNDPYYAGPPSQQIKAEWFAELWDRFGFAHGVHLRRIHYRLVSQEETLLGFNGKAYDFFRILRRPLITQAADPVLSSTGS